MGNEKEKRGGVSSSNVVPGPAVGRVERYAPPVHDAPIELKLDSNEGRPPGEDAAAELVAALGKAGNVALGRYPKAVELEADLARMMGVGPERVLATAGGDDAIERAVRAMLGPGREMVLPVPTFEMLERYAALAGGDVARVPWLRGGYPVEAVLAAVGERTGMIAMVSPNSPTGLAATGADVKRVAAGAAAVGALVLLDLAYTEFADEDLTAVGLGLTNVLVVRSMSKAWGMAGLRVGWAAGHEDVIEWLKATGHPYAVSVPSIVMARRRLAGAGAELEAFVEQVRRERARFALVAGRCGGEAIESQGNFVCVRFDDAAKVWDGLARRGVRVRIFPDAEHLEGFLRVTMPGDEREYGRLVAALEAVTGAA